MEQIRDRCAIKCSGFSVCVCVCESLRHCCWGQYPSLNLVSTLQCFYTVVEHKVMTKIIIIYIGRRMASMNIAL